MSGRAGSAKRRMQNEPGAAWLTVGNGVICKVSHGCWLSSPRYSSWRQSTAGPPTGRRSATSFTIAHSRVPPAAKCRWLRID